MCNFPERPHPFHVCRRLKATLAPLLPAWEKGLGDEGGLKVAHRVLNYLSTSTLDKLL